MTGVHDWLFKPCLFQLLLLLSLCMQQYLRCIAEGQANPCRPGNTHCVLHMLESCKGGLHICTRAGMQCVKCFHNRQRGRRTGRRAGRDTALQTGRVGHTPRVVYSKAGQDEQDWVLGLTRAAFLHTCILWLRHSLRLLACCCRAATRSGPKRARSRADRVSRLQG